MITDAAHDDELTARLRGRGLRVTSQRVVIYRELHDHPGHRTAEDIHDAVKGRLPGTSLPTVYATLDLLADMALVRRINPGMGAALYDVRTDPHHHTVCRTCGRVEDLEATGSRVLLAAAERAGFAAEAVEILVSGQCAACRR